MSRRPHPGVIVNAIARLGWGRQTEAQREWVFQHSRLLWPPSAEQRVRDTKAEAASRYRQQFMDCLPGMPEPQNRATDMCIGYRNDDDEIVGIAGFTHLAKGSTVARFYARTHRLQRNGSHVLAEVQVNCHALGAKRMRKALGKAANFTIRQMRNPDLRPCGYIWKSEVSEDAVATLHMAITDASAVQKLASRTYTGCILAVDDGGDITDVSLVDAPFDHLGEELAKRRPEVLAKIYDGALMKAKKAKKNMKNWMWAEEMSQKHGGTPMEWMRGLEETKAGMITPKDYTLGHNYTQDTATKRGYLTPAQHEQANIGDLIRAKVVTGFTATNLAKRADDARHKEEIALALRRPTSIRLL